MGSRGVVQGAISDLWWMVSGEWRRNIRGWSEAEERTVV